MRAIVAVALASTLLASTVLSAHGAGGGHGGGTSSGGHASGGHASGSHAGGATHSTATARGTATPRRGGTNGSPTPGHRRTGRPVLGTAVPRFTPRVTGVSTVPLPLCPTYRLSPFYAGVGFGLYSYALWPGYVSGYPTGSSGDLAPSSPFDAEGPTGGLRLKIQPKEAQVFVDGYYAGIVDDFDGVFQHLDVVPGPHHVEVRAPGYDVLAVDVIIQAHHTLEYRGRLSPRTSSF